MIRAISWAGGVEDGVVEMIDQRRLPSEEMIHRYSTVAEVAEAIRAMVIRGAPAIGIAAAMGYVLAARAQEEITVERLREARASLAATRPTAVNLFWALERMDQHTASLSGCDRSTALASLHAEALAIHEEDIGLNRAMGQHGLSLFPEDTLNILTHCNTGSLATGGLGTALGVIHACHSAGKAVHVWVDETRPYLQGARLTAWECLKEGIPATLITDSMAGFFMQRGKVDAVIVGADRVAANGDAANKIGTYSLAVLCKHHGIPFYVAAPTSTLDLSTPHGDDIPIEERSAEEVREIKGVSIAPAGIPVRHPAFDVTPAALISGIVTEQGVARAPYGDVLKQMVEAADAARAASKPSA